MIPELEALISKVELLKEEDQKEIARIINEEIVWENSLNNSQEQLSRLANEALDEYTAGSTKSQNW
ncbi:MAG TPA: hypothetical protein VF610_06705 [Segetibacter sp.]|jgi:aspartate/glutamate racemase